MLSIFRRRTWLTLGVVFLAFLAWGQSRKTTEDESQIKALVESQSRVLVHDDTESLFPQDLRGVNQAASSIKNDANKTTTVQGTVKQIAAGTLPTEIRAVTAHGITAHFGGEKSPVEVDAPLEYGVEALWFTFEGKQRFYVFKPKGELFFTDWSFDVFSPDGAHVLLPQSHYGPYHVVASDRLKDYLV